MDEVVDDLCPLDGPRDIFGGARVALDPADAGFRLLRGARNGDKLVLGREQRHQRAADDSRRAEDRNPHVPTLEASSSK